MQASDFHTILLPGDNGFLKLLLGAYAEQASKVKTYGDQFMYHLVLKEGKQFSLSTKSEQEYAAFIIEGSVTVNSKEVNKENLIVFGSEGDTIQLENTSNEPAEVILFGGEPYTENIVAQGPFVMNSQQEIVEAYNDAKGGKYGTIKYELPPEKSNLTNLLTT